MGLSKLACNPLMHCDQQFENHQLKEIIIRVKERNDLVDEFRAKGLYDFFLNRDIELTLSSQGQCEI